MKDKAEKWYDESGLKGQLQACIDADDDMVNFFMRDKTIANLVNFATEQLKEKDSRIKELEEKAITYLRELSNLEEGWDEELEVLTKQ